jgi:hypothetical protein
MTTVYTMTKTCYVCKHTNEFEEISSTSAFGSSDLDNRPPDMGPDALEFCIQKCPSCGYCAPDISTGPHGISDVLRSLAYNVKKMKKPFYPGLARKFLRWSIALELLEDYWEAGGAALSAAWVCDDARARKRAENCRKEAIRLFEKAMAEGTSFAESQDPFEKAMAGDTSSAERPGIEDVIMVDLLRRSRQFNKAEIFCQQAIAKMQDEMIKQEKAKMDDGIIRRALLFEQILIKDKDRECYTFGQAMGMSKDRPSFGGWLDRLDQKGIGGE